MCFRFWWKDKRVMLLPKIFVSLSLLKGRIPYQSAPTGIIVRNPIYELHFERGFIFYDIIGQELKYE